MKKPLFCILTIAATSVLGENLLIRFYPDNQPLLGLTNWPAALERVSWATNSPGWSTNMSEATYASYMAALQPKYDAAIVVASNALYALTINNRRRIVELFNQIPTARSQIAQIQNTNLASVAACSIAIKTEANILDGILEELQRLGPVLKDIYKPDQDTTP